MPLQARWFPYFPQSRNFVNIQFPQSKQGNKMSDFEKGFRAFYSPQPEIPTEEAALQIAQMAFSKALAAEFAIVNTIGIISHSQSSLRDDVLIALRNNMEMNKDSTDNHQALARIVSMIEGIQASERQ